MLRPVSSGTARNAGGAVAICIYTLVLSKKQASVAAVAVPKAVIAAGGTSTIAANLLTALPLGATYLEKVPGATLQMIEAAGVAYQYSYQKGLQ